MATPNFPELEQQILADWKKHDIFRRSLAKPAPRGRFVFFEGPPTANGMPHIGHVETRAFKDIIPRFKTMQGFQVERKAGWDTQGLPVELGIEKELGISGKKDIEKYGIAEFNAKAKESVWKYKALWEEMSERVGFWLDTEKPYITYSNDYIETLWWIFAQTWKLGLLEQDFKVVPYCPRCGTALSSHEVAQGYQKVADTSVVVQFELEKEPGTFVLAWTTTPWTLPGNVALAINPKVKYVKSKNATTGESFIYAASQRINVLLPADAEKPVEVKAKDLIGKSYKPLFDFLNLGKETGKKTYYIVDADFVTTQDGTGVVHTAVMYGEDDFQLGQKHDLPKIHTVDLQGKFTELVKPWAGLEVKDAEGKTQLAIIDYLKEKGKLYKEESYTHDYPFCWRCKHPLLYYAKTSWFIRMSKLRQQLLDNNAKVNWHPKHIQDGRFGEWLREVKDWAISRERYWGTPIPIWVCDNSDCSHQECLAGYGELAKKVESKNTYLFIRHGQSDNNIAHTLDTELGNGSANLTEMGHEQAKAAGEQLKEKHVDLIFSSQFPRAKQTADEIATILGKEVSEDKRLNEFHIGPEFEDKTYDEYHEVWGDRADRFHRSPEGGETWMQIRDRLVSFMNDCETQYQGKTILVVTHADPILVLQWATSCLPESAVEELEYPKNGGVVEVHYPAAMFARNASFDPHRPFIDDVTYPCTKCHGTMKRIPEVADTWFDSGAMPFAQWHYPFENKERIDDSTSYPADFISEAIDQTRGWFYTLLAIGTILEKAGVVEEGPYKNVVVLGHLNDAKGRKMSKSLGNYVDPMGVIDQYGADAVRWFLFTINQPWDTKNFDQKGIEEGVKKMFLILTNVLSFWEMYNKENIKPVNSKNILDRWVLAKTNHLVSEVTARLEEYEITAAGRLIGAFVTDLSTWYVRRSRDRFKSDEAAAAVATLRQVLETVAKLLAPFTPFLADHLYKAVGGEADSVHLVDWPTAEKVDEQLVKDMDHVRGLVEKGHALRAKAGIKVRQPLQQFLVTSEVRPELDDILREELNVKEIHTSREIPVGNEWVSDEQAALDTSISDELKAEGMLRDLIREFNALRKTAKLQPTDEIVALIDTNSEAARVVEMFSQEFLRGVRAKAVTASLDTAEHKAEIELDGQKVGIGLVVKK